MEKLDKREFRKLRGEAIKKAWNRKFSTQALEKWDKCKKLDLMLDKGEYHGRR